MCRITELDPNSKIDNDSTTKRRVVSADLVQSVRYVALRAIGRFFSLG